MSAGGRRDADLISCRRSSELMSAGGGEAGRAMGAASAGSPRRCGGRLCTDSVSFHSPARSARRVGAERPPPQLSRRQL